MSSGQRRMEYPGIQQWQITVFTEDSNCTIIHISSTAKGKHPFFRNKHIYIRKNGFPAVLGSLFPAVFGKLPEYIALAVAHEFRLRPVFAEVFYNIIIMNSIVDERQQRLYCKCEHQYYGNNIFQN